MLLLFLSFQLFMPKPPTTQNSLNPKSNPQTATYLRVDPIGYYNDCGGYEILIVKAMIPNEYEDTLYSGVVHLHAIESNPNGSAQFISLQTFLPTDSAVVDSGTAVVLLTDVEAETLGVYVSDAADSLKSSIPVSFFIDSATTTNIPYKARIEGPDTTNSSNMFYMQDILYISVVDSNYMVDTSICDWIGDTTKASVKIINNPDTSAFLYNPFDGTYGTEVNVPMVKGRGWLFFYNFTDVSETVTLVAEDIDAINDFGSDTFNIYITAAMKATKLFPFSITGAYGNVNVNKIYYLMAMLDGPDPTNSSTNVRLKTRDIQGSQSVTVSPSNFATLQGGIYSFKVLNTETDSFTFMFPESQGSPYLYPVAPAFVAGFKDSGKAVMFKGRIPTMVPVNDTFYTECYAVDMYGNVDTTYHGWMDTDADDDHGSWSINFIDSLGTYSEVFEINKGIASFGFYDTEEETIRVGYNDAEGEEPFCYLGSNMLDEYEVWITPARPGMSTRWLISEYNNITKPGNSIYVTVAAVNDSGYIDPLFPSDAVLSVTGSATVSPDTLHLDNGVGICEVYDNIYETVYLTVTGGGLVYDEDTLMFIPPDSGAYVMTDSYGEIFVNDTAHLSGWILNTEYTLADNYNGYVKVYIQNDPRNPNTVYPLEAVNPDSIPVTNGLFSATFSDSEPEYISLIIEDVRGKLQSSKSDGLFYTVLDKYLLGPHEVNLEDTARVILKDVYNDTIEINSGIYEDTFDYYINEIGGSIPFSFNFTSPNPAGFQNGVSYCSFYNTEIETLEVYVNPRDYELFRNTGLIDKVFYTGLEDVGNHFTVHANPVQKGDLSINYSIPMDGKVEITVFDIAGRQIYKNERNFKRGVYRFEKNRMSSGIYFVNVKYNDILDSRKIVLLH